MNEKKDWKKKLRSPYMDLAFMKKYMIRCRTDEIESFVGVIEKLTEEYDATLLKKHAVNNELLKVVEEKTKELQLCHEECQKKEMEIQTFMEEKIALNQAIREKAENDLKDYREMLEDIERTVEERTKQLEYWQEYADEGQNKLEWEIKTLTEKIERAEKEFQNSKDFIHKLWEHYRLFYVKNESENMNAMKMKYLDAGIDGLSHKQRVVIKEKFRLILEIKQQMSKIEDQKKEYGKQVNTAEMYRLHLDKLRRRFYNIVPIPEWTRRMKFADPDAEYINHEEPDLCEHENPFRVPLNVETTWVNYRNLEREEKQSSVSGSSVVVNGDESCTDATSSWTFDKRRVIRAAHEPLDLPLSP